MSTSEHETGDPDQSLPGTEGRQEFHLWDEKPVEEGDAVSGVGEGEKADSGDSGDDSE